MAPTKGRSDPLQKVREPKQKHGARSRIERFFESLTQPQQDFISMLYTQKTSIFFVFFDFESVLLEKKHASCAWHL